MQSLLSRASSSGYAVGAFNIYNLEVAMAVITAAEDSQSPAIIQLKPKAFEFGGVPLLDLCLSAADHASVPICVHLDHAHDLPAIKHAIECGFPSVMVDGSALQFEDNVMLVRSVVAFASQLDVSIEAELGLLKGFGKGVNSEGLKTSMTDPAEAERFVNATGITSLAVCIGNVHGDYVGEPKLDFDRLRAIGDRVSIPLVLHGASGLPEESIRETIRLGVAKINVNTDLRREYFSAIQSVMSERETRGGDELINRIGEGDLIGMMRFSMRRVSEAISHKMGIFGSVGEAEI